MGFANPRVRIDLPDNGARHSGVGEQDPTYAQRMHLADVKVRLRDVEVRLPAQELRLAPVPLRLAPVPLRASGLRLRPPPLPRHLLGVRLPLHQEGPAAA